MEDSGIFSTIDRLVAEEHDLRRKLAEGELTADDEHRRMKRLEQELDQCWDLLRQRRARRDAGRHADGAAVRPVDEVEGYQQ